MANRGEKELSETLPPLTYRLNTATPSRVADRAVDQLLERSHRYNARAAVALSGYGEQLELLRRVDRLALAIEAATGDRLAVLANALAGMTSNITALRASVDTGTGAFDERAARRVVSVMQMPGEAPLPALAEALQRLATQMPRDAATSMSAPAADALMRALEQTPDGEVSQRADLARAIAGLATVITPDAGAALADAPRCS